MIETAVFTRMFEPTIEWQDISPESFGNDNVDNGNPQSS